MVNLSFHLRSRFYIATIHQDPSPILCRRNPLERLDHPFTATRRHLPLRHLPGRIACLKQESAKLRRRQLSMVGELPGKLHRDDLIDDRYTNGWFPSIGHLLGETTSRFHWEAPNRGYLPRTRLQGSCFSKSQDMEKQKGSKQRLIQRVPDMSAKSARLQAPVLQLLGFAGLPLGLK